MSRGGRPVSSSLESTDDWGVAVPSRGCERPSTFTLVSCPPPLLGEGHAQASPLAQEQDKEHTEQTQATSPTQPRLS